MIGLPFDNNDLPCLGSISEIMAGLLRSPAPVLQQIAARYPTTPLLAAWIRSLPQRNDDGDPEDGPRVEACEPTQRLRIPAPDPNCVERTVLYMVVAELIDPSPVRQMATLDFAWGRHTFPIENGAPIVLDPRVTYDELLEALPVDQRAPLAHPREQPGAAEAPLVIDIHDAIDFTSELAQQGAASVRNGPSRVFVARNALRNFIATSTPPGDAHTADAIGWFFSIAEQVARAYGARALTIVRTTALAISELIDDVLAQRQAPRTSRSRSAVRRSVSRPGCRASARWSERSASTWARSRWRPSSPRSGSRARCSSSSSKS